MANRQHQIAHLRIPAVSQRNGEQAVGVEFTPDWLSRW